MLKTRIPYRVPYADTDQMAVVYYANYLAYFERVRNEMLRETGLPYTEFEKAGIMLPVIEAHCDYKIPAKYDDLLELQAGFTEIKGCRVRVENKIYCGDTLLATGYTRHAFMSAETRRPIKAPDFVQEAIEKYIEEQAKTLPSPK